ncbi:MAG: putative metallopeptidase [Syntrophaceae bacterium]
MTNRYEEVDESVIAVLSTIRKKSFPELVNAKIKPLFDLKKRVSGGSIVLARIMLPNELIKYFTSNEKKGIEDGYDYIIAIDKVIWQNAPSTDRERLLRHELRHTFIDIEADNPYRLIDHDVSDFYEEMELNQDDPRWKERVASLAETIYEQMKDEAKSRGRGRGRKDVGPIYDGPTPIEVYAAERAESKEE